VEGGTKGVSTSWPEAWQSLELEFLARRGEFAAVDTFAQGAQKTLALISEEAAEVVTGGPELNCIVSSIAV
jgi:hypothetical protein